MWKTCASKEGPCFITVVHAHNETVFNVGFGTNLFEMNHSNLVACGHMLCRSTSRVMQDELVSCSRRSMEGRDICANKQLVRKIPDRLGNTPLVLNLARYVTVQLETGCWGSSQMKSVSFHLVGR
jgi:hypothetical protein